MLARQRIKDRRWAGIFDAYAVIPRRPTTAGIVVSIVSGLLVAAYAGWLCYAWSTNPYASHLATTSTGATTLTLTVTCHNGASPLDCYIEHTFPDSAACAALVPATASVVTSGNTGSAVLCYSDSWQDGVRITVPTYVDTFPTTSTFTGSTAVPTSTLVTFTANGVEVPFPVPVIDAARPTALYRRVTMMDYTARQDTANRVVDDWSISYVSLNDEQCTNDITGSGYTVIQGACYFLKLARFKASVKQSPVFEWVQIVAEIGGAAVTIFSLLGLCLMCYAYSGAESISIDAEDGFLGDELFDMDVRLQ